jgi:hypothetical protein
MISRPTHSRVIKAAAITGRDSTVRYSATLEKDDAQAHDALRPHAAVLFAFDLIEHDGETLRRLPLIERNPFGEG